jgi:SAM-dependent methyltransferase
VPGDLVLRAAGGELLPLHPARWYGEASPTEEELLREVAAPVLDVGCGPGRLVVGLGRLGMPALGVDPAPGAVELARRRGATVLQRSVFDPLPGQGRWRTILLIDGNIGIGGDPTRLLRRCRELAAPGATIVAEVESPGTARQTHRVRLERGSQRSQPFPWAVVGVDAIGGLGAVSGLALRHVRRTAGESRWFAHLVRPEESALGVA